MPSQHPQRLSSTVQVEITFENPVVFAGQSIHAIITFKNTNEASPVPLGTSTGSREIQNDSTVSNDHQEEPCTQSATISEEVPDDSEGANNMLVTSGSNGTRPTRAMSARMTSPFMGALTTSDSTHPDLKIETSSPLSPTSEVPSIITTAPDSSAIVTQIDTPVVPQSSQFSLEGSTFSEEESPVSTTSGGGGWELPGRRLSSHLANSIREFYWGNTSTPDVTPNSTQQSDSNPSSPASTERKVQVSRLPLSPADSTSSNLSTSIWGSRGSRQFQHQLTRSGSTYLQSQRSQTTSGLLMGYVQLQGYFVVDDELIDANEFSRVKTQGVVVGPNGGIGYGSSNGSGLLQGLASGLGSLLQIRDSAGGGSSPDRTSSPDRASHSRGNSRSGRSNSKVRTDIAKNDAIPIFSTPQSLLFVDLKLSPGETRSYSYRLELPETLPPSCRAKSIRIHYNLVVGIQKLDQRGRPQPKTTLVPFRVFPHVSKDGQQYTHDLRTPIVLQKDIASVVQLPSNRNMSMDQISKYVESQTAKPTKSGSFEEDKAEFFSYIEGLLSGNESIRNKLLSQQHGPPDVLSTSSEPDNRRKSSSAENIKYISRYQHTSNPSQALKSRFDIVRSGKKIATVILSKPVFRVGENVVFVVDYAGAALKCFHITASLETEEAISCDLLKQFKNQIDDVELNQFPTIDTSAMTRRVYSQSTMSTYSLSKTPFEFTIPATASPQFSTSSISLRWVLKIDFITSPTPTAEEESILSQQEINEEEDQQTVPALVSVIDQPQGPDEHPSSTRRTPTNNPNNNDPNEQHEHPNTQQQQQQQQQPQQDHVPSPVAFPFDSKSPLEVVHLNSQGLIATTKENIPCESFNCKIPLTVLPTNQDISALLEHSVSTTRTCEM